MSVARRCLTIALVLFCSAPLAFALAALAVAAAEDAVISLHWPRAEAVITAVAPLPRRPKNTFPFDLRLAVETPDGRIVGAAAARAITREKSWSAPLRPPQVGERLPVLLDPGRPDVVVPVEALTSRWFGLLLALLLFCLAYFAWVLATLVVFWPRRCRTSGSGGRAVAAVSSPPPTRRL